VTGFFATAFIQTLRLSQKEIERLGHAHDDKLADMLSKSMVAFPEEPVKFFHHYECEVQRIQREPEKCTILVPSCDLVLSINGENKTLGQGSELLGVVSQESLTFILAVARPSGKFCQFIDISMRSILESTRTFRQYTDGGMSRLILEFDVDASLSVNGKRQTTGESTLSITSHHHLTNLYTTIETNGKQKRQSTDLSTLTRMSSSIIIALDTYDDDSGSFDYSQSLFEIEERHSMGCLESNGNHPENKTCGSQATSGSHDHGFLSQQPKSARGTSVMGDSLHLLSLDHGVSKQHGRERASLAAERKSPQQSMADEGGNPPTLKEYSDNSAENPHKGLLDCAVAKIDTSTWKNSPTHVHSSQSQGSEEKDAGWLHVQKSRRRPRKQQQKKGLTSSKKARRLMPDTQESLIFPTRHSTRKNYTHARASVDWDEDLRPSKEPEQLERQKSIDVTSISSPPAGEKSVFDQAARKGTKRKSKGKTSSSKRRKTSKKASLDNREGQRGTEESNLVQESIPEGTVDVTNVPSMNAELAASKGSRTKADQAPKDKTVAGSRTLTDDAPDVALVAVTEVSGVERSIAFLMDQAQEIGCPLILESFSATGDQHAGQTSNRQIAKESSDRDETQTTSYPGFKQNGLGGRGRVVGDKLAAAIHDGCSFSPAGEERQEDATLPDGDTGSLRKEDVGRHAMSALPLQHEDSEPRAVKVQPQDALVTRTNRTTHPPPDTEPAVAREQTSQKYPEIIQQISSTRSKSRKRGAVQTEKDNASRKKTAHKKLSTLASAEPESQVDKPEPQSQEVRGPRKSEPGLFALKAGLENGREQISTGERETATSGDHSLKSIRPRQKPEDGSSDQAGPKILPPVKTIPRLTPRKTIVDNNGSPRLVSRHTAGSQRSTHTNFDFEQGHGAIGMSLSQGFSESGYEADFDEHPEGEIPLENPGLSSFRTKMDAHRRKSLSKNSQTAAHEEASEETPVTGGRNGMITSKVVTTSGDEFTLYFPSKRPKSPRRLDMSNTEGDGATEFSSKEEGCPIDSRCDPTETSPSSEVLPGQADIATSLQSLHESARDMLRITNEVCQCRYTMNVFVLLLMQRKAPIAPT
jgi:hypothetical protein